GIAGPAARRREKGDPPGTTRGGWSPAPATTRWDAARAVDQRRRAAHPTRARAASRSRSSSADAWTRRRDARRLLLLLPRRELRVPHAVPEVEHHPDHEPNDQPLPRPPR